MHELKLYEVQKKYKDKTAVKQVSYTFKHGVYGLLRRKRGGKNNSDASDLWSFAANHRKYLL